MTLLIISFLAGVLTVLAPCILPLLPVVIGSSVGARSRTTPYIVIGSLALSILLFTYLLKASTVLISIPPYIWSYLAGTILAGFGLTLVFPTLWESLPGRAKTSASANLLVGAGHQKQSAWGDVLVGAALGPVFSTCSPTYFVILATVLPASFLLGTIYLLAYIVGLVLMLALIALLGQKLIGRLQFAADSRGVVKKLLGVMFILLGLAIIAGLDKTFETWLLDNTSLDITRVEQRLLDRVNETEETPVESAPTTLNRTEAPADIPPHLARNFPATDWTGYDPALKNALSGGPPRDGIPAIDEPTYTTVAANSRPDDVQAIVLIGETETKVYPYNILIWHEIVNDTIDGRPVAITFCPLCGSAIAFNRTLPDGTVSTFGVTGSLLESNMIMYDRATENLWQQSTGATLAGSFHPATLSLVPFQLLTMGEVREYHPDAVVLSEDTGYQRNYGRNPYTGYDDEHNAFYFVPSSVDSTIPAKTIVVVWRAGNTPVAIPWLALREANTHTVTHDSETYRLTIDDSNTLTITDESGTTYPFYFEMWFSYAVQHGASSVLFEI